NHLPSQAERGGARAQLATKSASATHSANPGEGCPTAASAITSFRDRRISTMIWAVRMRRRPRTHCCALSANSRLRQPDTYWTHCTRVNPTDPNRGLRLGTDLCLTTRPLHSRGQFGGMNELVPWCRRYIVIRTLLLCVVLQVDGDRGTRDH